MPTTGELIDFVVKHSGWDRVNANSDIFWEIGVSGDDFHEMIEKFAKQYSVDMSGYRWYFHTNEEGSTFPINLFIKPPYDRVDRIPVTPALLAEFANKRKWDIQYPAHTLPKRRYDIIICQIFFGLLLIGMIVFCVIKYIR